MPAETHRSGGPPLPEDVELAVVELVAEVAGTDPSVLGRATRLRDDLGLGDLALIDLVEAVEEELGERTVGLVLDDDALADLERVGDLVDEVLARLDRSGGAS